MSQEGPEWEPLLPLPDLPVRRETFCTQGVVDQATHYLVRQHPELMKRMRLEDFAGTDTDLSDAAWGLLEALDANAAEIGLAVPINPVGRLDLACEISRRLRSAYGRRDRKARGKPLAETADQLPPLCSLQLDERPKRRLTQEQVDILLQASYAAHPELWFAVAEEYRIDLRLDANSRFRSVLRDALLASVSAVATRKLY